MKSFLISVSGKTEVDIYNAIAHVQKLVHKHQLSGEGTLIKGFLEASGRFNFKSYGDYDVVLPKEVEEALERTEVLLGSSEFYFENRNEFELHELNEQEKYDFENRNPEVVHPNREVVKQIVFDIIVSGESEYAVEEYLKWVYEKVSRGTLSQKLSRITMLPQKISGYCSIVSSGKYQSTFDSILTTDNDEDDEDEEYYTDNNSESIDAYCSACQQDPCECSDREKTSTVHDF